MSPSNELGALQYKANETHMANFQETPILGGGRIAQR